MKQHITNYFFSEQDVQLFDLDNIYVTSSVWHDSGMGDHIATFDLFIRDMPPHRNFLISGGLEEMVYLFQRWRYSNGQITTLLKDKLISKSFAKYLKDFRFRCDVWAIPEGTVFFPGEPIVRVTGPLIDANLFTMVLMNCVNVNVLHMSKFIRVVLAAAPKAAIGPAPQRGHGFEAGLKNQRSGYLVGGDTIAIAAARRKFGLLSYVSDIANANHAFIKSFPTELDALRHMRDYCPVKFSAMVDTYNFQQGVMNVIKIVKESPKRGRRLSSIVIDSGDLAVQCRHARRELDHAGLSYIKIILASNLDEYKILAMRRAGVPADGFIVDTAAITSSDSPVLETVYKLSELRKDGRVEYKMKLSSGKVSLPGRKQVYRIIKNGQYRKDIIGLQGEGLGKQLLEPIFKNGKLVYKLPTLEHIKEFISKEVSSLPPRLRRVDKEFRYPVEYSVKLKHLIDQTKRVILHQ